MARSIAALLMLLSVIACGPDDGHDGDDGAATSPDQAGAACELPSDCYPEVDPATLAGEVLCLDRVRAGYCTHECTADEDCCAADGECVSEFTQVCSPFESADARMCFLSCEGADVDAAGAPDEQSFCHDNVSYDFMCRSSGGGSANRKVCVPGDCGVGAVCAGDADCAPDLVCADEFEGGYCSRRDCGANADCPADTVCVEIDGGSACMKSCTADGDCELCRSADAIAACTAEVTFVEAGTTGSVCLAPAA